MKAIRLIDRRAARAAVVVAAAAAVAMASTVSAGAQTTAPAAGKGRVKAIAFFGFAAANSFAQATWAGVQQTAKKNHVSAKFFDPNFNAQTQVSQIQDAITTGRYQAFVIQANDGNAVIPAIKQALKAHIAVVAEFTPVGSNYATTKPPIPGMTFVGESPVHNGTELGALGIQACKGLNPCNVAYLEGFKSLPLDNARTNAVKKELATAKNVKLVADVEGGYTQASGLKAAQDVLQAHSNVNVMIGSSQAIEGAQQALKAVGKLGKVKLIGNGGSCQALAGVRKGTWFAAYVIAEKSSGAKAAQLAIDAGNGKKVPITFNTDQLQNPIGTKKNLGNFKAQYCD
ncbi:MAG: sugar ABC transporter substrate-binding protein [Gaiellaceae bacterium]